MQKHQDAILLDTTGAPAANATILVKNFFTGLAATIYGTNDRTQPPITNPITIAAADDGTFQFYAANGRYTLDISGANISSKTVTDFILFDPLESADWAIATGNGDAMIASVPLASYQNGQKIRVRAPGANTVVAPVITVNGLPAVPITKAGGLPLVVGEYSASQELELTYNAATGWYELTNKNAISASFSIYSQDSSLLTTTVQEKLRQSGIISANADGGCVGDDATDNQPALYLLRDFMRANPRPWTLNFAPGTYRYSKNQWQKGINDLTINAEGSSFKCTSASGFSFDKYPFTGNQGIFNSSGYDNYVSASTTFGYKFGTVDGSGSTVTTIVAADAGNFAAGNKVLIYGFGQQDASFPPNPRYFEYNEVVSADAGTGIVTLKNPLKNAYDSAWHDFVQGKGAPRIQNLSRAANDFTFAKRLVVNGGYWMPSTVTPSVKAFQCEGYDQVVLNGVKADDFTPTVCRTFELINCDFATCEMDKIISSIKFRGGRVGGLTEGTGVERVDLLENVLMQGIVNVRPRVLVIDGAIMDCIGGAGSSLAMIVGAAYPVDLVDIRSARWSIKDPTVTALMNGGVETSFLVDAVSSNTKVTVLCANEAAFESLYQALQVGYHYRMTSGAKKVRITKIYDQDATHAAIEGEFSVIPVAAETYKGSNIEQIRLGDVTQIGPYAPVKAINFARQQNHDIKVRDRGAPRLCWTEIDVPRQASGVAAQGIDTIIRGYVLRIVVFITKVYSGADANNLIRISAQVPAVVTYAQVAGKTAGVREVTAFGSNGGVAGDTLTPTAGAYVDTLRLFMENGAGGFYPAYTDPVELPKYTVLVEYLKP